MAQGLDKVDKVLVVGAGTAGCALGILLGRAGVKVDLAELKTDFTVRGSGITLQGNALRSFRELGVWDEIEAHGFAFDNLGLCAPDGSLLVELTDYRTGGPDLPATVGMNRPKMAEILTDAARAQGATFYPGTTVSSYRQDPGGVDVVFSDGRRDRYDLVVGADGIRSHMRSLMGIDVQPEPTGMAIWRVHAKRPSRVVRTDLIYGGACYIAGYCPTSEDTIYAYLVEDARPRDAFTPVERATIMRGLAASYHGVWDEIRDDITDPERINYTRFESLLVDRPWHRGRVVLIGDAAHACPPTLAQGAAMCLEDALVLAELLISHGQVDEQLFEQFMDRRFDRARTVVEESVQLGRWLLDSTPEPDVAGLMGRVTEMVSQPA